MPLQNYRFLLLALYLQAYNFSFLPKATVGREDTTIIIGDETELQRFDKTGKTALSHSAISVV